MTLIISWIVAAIKYGSAILFGAIGETITEKSGHLNLGTPGIMVFGGAFGFLSAFLYENACAKAGTTPSVLLLLLMTLTVGFVMGAFAGMIYAFLTVSLRANQNVTGLALTTFSVGAAQFFAAYMIPKGSVAITCSKALSIYSANVPFLANLGTVGKIFFSYGFGVYLAVAVAIVTHLVLNRTKVGLNLRAIGESPATADAAGINVTKYKYFSLAIASGISGVGGTFYIIYVNNGQWATQAADELEAFGWLAVALVIFSIWKTVNSIWGAYLFGLCYWAYQYLPALLGISISTDISRMLPYLVTIFVLILISLRKSRETQPPAALGLSYFREER